MGDLSRSANFQDGVEYFAAEINAILESLTIKASAISDKTAITDPASSDEMLIRVGSFLRKITYASLAQSLAGSAYWREYGLDTGSANAYVIALPTAPTAYAVGMRILLLPVNTNTGASTINVNGLGTKSIKRPNGAALSAGDLTAGRWAVLIYDGTDFRIVNFPAPLAWADLTGVPSTFTPAAHTHPLSELTQSSAVQFQAMRWNGTAWVAQSEDALPYILVQDRKASGTDGGTFTSGARRDRTLNTLVHNIGSLASLSGGTTGTGGTANIITLPAGTYYVRGSAPAYRVDNHRAWLYDNTNAADLLIGTSEHARTDNANAQTRSLVQGRITLAGTTDLKLQHRCESSFNTTGLGEGDSFDINIYSQLEFWKLA